jgi:FXSXX-COOH protein
MNKPVRRHTPLSQIDPHGKAAVRSAGRVTDIPGRRPVRPITFDSAL